MQDKDNQNIQDIEDVQDIEDTQQQKTMSENIENKILKNRYDKEKEEWIREELNKEQSNPMQKNMDPQFDKVFEENINVRNAEKEFQKKMHTPHLNDTVKQAQRENEIKQNNYNDYDSRNNQYNSNVAGTQSVKVDNSIKPYNRSGGGSHKEKTEKFFQQFGSPNKMPVSTDKRVRGGKYILNVTKKPVQMVSSETVMMLSNSEAGRGFENARLITSTGYRMAVITSGAAYNIVYNGLNHNNYNTLRNQIASQYKVGNNIKDIRRAINRDLLKNGFPPLKSSGYDLSRVCNRNYKRALKRNVPREILVAYKMGEKLGNLEEMKKPLVNHRNLKQVSGVSKMMMLRQLSKCEAGQGIRISSVVLSKTKNLLKRSIRVARLSTHLTAITMRKTIIFHTKRQIKKAIKLRKQMEGNIGKPAAELTQLQKKSSKLEDKLKKKKEKKKVQRKKKEKIDHVKKKMKDPFGIRKKMSELRNKAGNKIKKATVKQLKKIPGATPVARAVRRVTDALGGVLQYFGKSKKVMKRAFSYVGWGIAGFIIIIVVSYMIQAAITSAYNAAADKRIKDAKDILYECYKEDMDTIANLNYDEKTIVYDDKKDEDEYNKKWKEAGKKDEDNFKQVSNVAEILSMAFVKYGHDLSSEDFSKIEDYLRGLWHGSHQIVIESNSVTSGEGDDASTTTSATITYQTDYFNSLFECSLEDATIQIGGEDDAGNDADVVEANGDDSAKNVYTFFRANNFTHEQALGFITNLCYETTVSGGINANNYNTFSKSTAENTVFNPKCDNENGNMGGFGIVQWTSCGQRKEKVKNWIKSKYGEESLYDINAQLPAIIWELNNSAKGVMTHMNSSKNDSGKCAYIVASEYERCAESIQPLRQVSGKRMSEIGVFEEYKDKSADDIKKEVNEESGGTGGKIAKFAQKFVGKLHYAGDGSHWRGTSLSTTNGGTDCSGFVSLIYQKYAPDEWGKKTFRTSDGIANDFSTNEINKSQAKPGDIVVSKGLGHTGIYIGNGKMVAMSGCNCGKHVAKAGPCPNDCKVEQVKSGDKFYHILKD